MCSSFFPCINSFTYTHARTRILYLGRGTPLDGNRLKFVNHTSRGSEAKTKLNKAVPYTGDSASCVKQAELRAATGDYTQNSCW